jgi:hypothetical protein
MMSCGICNKWQHIPCHDSADLRAGRRRRDWDIEEFICQRCRSRGSQKYDGANQPRQYQTLGSGRSQQPHAADRATYIQPTANFSAPRAHPGYAGVQPYAASTPNGQNGHDNFRTSTSTSMTQQRPYQPSAITFAHYQPDPAGFSTRQIYQRDLPSNSNSQAYQQQASYAGRSSQPLQPEAVTNFSPIQVSTVVELFVVLHSHYSSVRSLHRHTVMVLGIRGNKTMPHIAQVLASQPVYLIHKI